MGWVQRSFKTIPVRWEPAGGGHWEVTFRILEVHGRAECVGVEVRWPDEGCGDPRPMKADTLRFPFASLLLKARRETAKINRQLGEVAVRPNTGLYQPSVGPEGWREVKAGLDAGARLLDPPDGTKGGRRARYTPADLEHVVEVYSKAHHDGEAPTRAVEAALGVSRGMAGKLVWRCRRLGRQVACPLTLTCALMGRPTRYPCWPPVTRLRVGR